MKILSVSSWFFITGALKISTMMLRDRALLGSRPVNKIPRRRDDITLQE
jgi:hypothetical protein